MDYFIGIFKYSKGDIKVECVKEKFYTEAITKLHEKSGWDSDSYTLIVIPRKLLYIALGQVIAKIEDLDWQDHFKVDTTEFGELQYPKRLVHEIFNQIGDQL